MRELAFKLLNKLKELYAPYFLRWEKSQIFRIVSAEVIKRPLGTDELPLKTDLVIWMPLSNLQKEIYSLIVENQQNMLNRQGTVDQRNVFMLIMAMRQLCLHPKLFFKNSILKEDETEMQQMFDLKMIPSSMSRFEELKMAMKKKLVEIQGRMAQKLDFDEIEASSKLVFLFQLLPNLKNEGHKVLIFAKSLLLLDMLEKLIKKHKYTYERLDGSVK